MSSKAAVGSVHQFHALIAHVPELLDKRLHVAVSTGRLRSWMANVPSFSAPAAFPAVALLFVLFPVSIDRHSCWSPRRSLVGEIKFLRRSLAGTKRSSRASTAAFFSHSGRLKRRRIPCPSDRYRSFSLGIACLRRQWSAHCCRSADKSSPTPPSGSVICLPCRQ